jgi:lysophospholipase L1-like esterase
LIVKNNDYFKNRENAETKVFGKAVYIDKYGFRVPNNNYTYNQDNLGFLILGDSTSFGVGVKEEKTFVGQLRRNYPNNNFFNTSVIGYNLSHYSKVLQSKINDNYKIKHVILFLNINDIDFESVVFQDYNIKELSNNNDNFKFINWIKNNYIFNHLHFFLRERSVLYMWIKGIFTKTQERFYSHVDNLYKNKNYISKVNFEIISIKKNLQTYKSNLIVVILPYEFQTRKNNCNEHYLFPQNILKEILLKNSIKFYDYTDEFCNQKKVSNFFLKFDPVHLSHIGHDFVFELLKKDLFLRE